MQKAARRTNTLAEVNNSVKLLNEMLSHFNQEESSQADKELIKASSLHHKHNSLKTVVLGFKANERVHNKITSVFLSSAAGE